MVPTAHHHRKLFKLKKQIGSYWIESKNFILYYNPYCPPPPQTFQIWKKINWIVPDRIKKISSYIIIPTAHHHHHHHRKLFKMKRMTLNQFYIQIIFKKFCL